MLTEALKRGLVNRHPPSEILQRHGVVHWIADRRWRVRPAAMEGETGAETEEAELSGWPSAEICVVGVSETSRACRAMLVSHGMESRG